MGKHAGNVCIFWENARNMLTLVFKKLAFCGNSKKFPNL
jgi:hypothetical protein